MKLPGVPGGAVMLLLLVLGIIEFGFALYKKEVIINTSPEGARAGIILISPRPTATDITNVVTISLTSAGWDAAKATIAVIGAQGVPGSYPTVEYPYSFSVLPQFIQEFSNNIMPSAETAMQLE
jgi:hypothetical protein